MLVSSAYIPSSVMLVLLLYIATVIDNGFCTAASSSSVTIGAARYNLIPRDETRNAQETTLSESPMLISFDGDLNAIKELALAKANQSNPPNRFSCDDETTSHLEILDWVYSIETVPQASATTVFGEVQESTLELVAPQTLSCYNNQSAYANIVAMDSSTPGHEISKTGTFFIIFELLHEKLTR
jgi:hypothetical protein